MNNAEELKNVNWLVTGIPGLRKATVRRTSEEWTSCCWHDTQRPQRSSSRKSDGIQARRDANPEDVHAAVLDITETVGPIDVVVNNAGFGMVERSRRSHRMKRDMFATNVFGTLNVIQAVSTLPQRTAFRPDHQLLVGLAWRVRLGSGSTTRPNLPSKACPALALEVNPSAFA